MSGQKTNGKEAVEGYSAAVVQEALHIATVAVRAIEDDADGARMICGPAGPFVTDVLAAMLAEVDAHQ